MKLSLRLALASTLVLAPVALAFRQDPPAPKQQPNAEAQVYDETANARADVAAALARAKKENRRVLIQWGANWCHWCRLLHSTMTKKADVARELMYEYDVVRVDVGKFDKNIDFAKELGAEFKGIPFLTVLDADGKPLAQNDTTAFETEIDGKPGHDPAKLLQFLKEQQAPYLDAAKVRESALARAKSEGKRVFLHYGAPWCPWCHKLDDWMAQPSIAALLGKDFVDLKIDTDRMTGGQEMLKADLDAAGLEEKSGIPWIVFLDADGKALINSTGPAGNTGFPQADEELEHFAKMLGAARNKLTPEDIAALRESLLTIRREREARQTKK